MKETDWEGAIAVAMGGEGNVASNGFWAGLNIASTLHLPVLFFIEDNSYSLSVPSSLQTPNGNIATNLVGFGNLRTLQGDGTDPLEAWELIYHAINHVRGCNGPCLVRMRVPRLSGHTFIDGQAYKPPQVRVAEAARDPLPKIMEFLQTQGVSVEAWETLEHEVVQELASSLCSAESYPEPDPSQATVSLFL